MKFSTMRAMGLVFMASIFFGLTAIAAEQEQGPHGGKIIKPKPGQTYEVVTPKRSKEMKVYTTTVSEPLPNEMMVKVIQLKGPESRIHLQLIQKDASEAYYSGIVPANVSVSGGVRYEFEFMKTKELPPLPEKKDVP